MNSIEITRNKPEFIQNKERNYFLVISKQDQSRWRCQTMPCAAFSLLQTRPWDLLKTRRNGIPVFTPNSWQEKVPVKMSRLKIKFPLLAFLLFNIITHWIVSVPDLFMHKAINMFLQRTTWNLGLLQVDLLASGASLFRLRKSTWNLQWRVN